MVVCVYPLASMSNIAPLVSGSMLESESPWMDLRMVDIKLLVVFTLSAAHNALLSCCRRTSRISGNLVSFP